MLIENETFLGPETRDPTGKDTCALWIGQQDGFVVRNCPIVARAGAEALKITHSKNGEVYHNVLDGGYEDCLDMLACENIHVFENVMIIRGRTGITSKGGCSHIGIESNRFKGHAWHGSVIDVGGHTIYPDKPDDDHYWIHKNKVENLNLSFVRLWKHGTNIVIEQNKGYHLMKKLDLPGWFVDWWFYKENRS